MEDSDLKKRIEARPLFLNGMASDTSAQCSYFHKKIKCPFPNLMTKHLKTLNAFTSKPLLVMKPRKEFIALRQEAVAKEGKREGG